MPRTPPTPAASPVRLPTRTAVLLPGTGSDGQFVDRAFGPALRRRGITVLAVDPDPTAVVASYLTALDAAARDGPVLVGGVSIGAAVALRWAHDHPDLAVGVLAALPAWTGDAASAPAAAAARWTASELRSHGLETVTAAMTESSPLWLGRELSRSWRAQWPDLPSALEEAAGYRALDIAELRAVRVPVGITAATDDGVHPVEVGRQWVQEIPHARLATVTLERIGRDPGVLGSLCLAALEEMGPAGG